MKKLVARAPAFTLVEVVLAMGIVSFAVLATVGLLSVASDTNRRSRDETFAAQLAANEFERLRSAPRSQFPTGTYNSRYYTADLREVGANDDGVVYKFNLKVVNPPPAGTPADVIFNVDILYPAKAAAENQTKLSFTALANIPNT